MSVTLRLLDDILAISGKAEARPWTHGLRPVDMLPEAWDPRAVAWQIDGRPARGNDRLEDGSTILGVRRPALGVGGVGPLAGALGGILGSASGAQSVAATGAIAGAVSANAVLNFLSIPDLAARLPKDEDPVYGWSSIRAAYNPLGSPVPKQYGEHRVGLSVVSVDIENVSTADGFESYLRILGLISSGPIGAIGQYTADANDLIGDQLPIGLEINGNDARNFDGVTAWLRLGSSSQDPIPGFDVVRTTYPVGLAIQQGDGSVEFPVVTDWSSASTFTMPAGAEGDRCRTQISFPALTKIKADGSITFAEATFQVRTTRVDLVTGSPVGDPVVHPSAATSFSIKHKQTSAFTVDLEIPFIDPANYTPPTASGALAMDRPNLTNGRIPQGVIDSVGNAEFVDGARPQRFSFFCVSRLQSHETSNPLFAWGDWNESTGSPQVDGIVVWLEKQGAGTDTVSRVVVWYGDSTSAAAEVVVGGEIDASEWFSLAVCYTRVDTTPGNTRLDIYLNGLPIVTNITTQQIRVADTPSGYGPQFGVFPRKQTDVATFHGAIDFDEFTFYTDYKSSAQIQGLHAAGVWQSRINDPNVLFGATMDGIVTAISDRSAVYGPVGDVSGGFITWAPTGDVDEITGAVFDIGSVTTVRGRYKIEVQRTNADQTDLKFQDDATFSAVVVQLDERIGYIRSALVGLRILATGQLSDNQPNVTAIATGVYCREWDGVSETDPSFALVPSRVPAWQVMDILTDTADGLGDYFTLDDIILPDFYAWARFTQTRVYDQRGKRQIETLDVATVGSTLYLDVTVTGDLPTHWVPGVAVKLRNVPPGAAPYVSGLSRIVSIAPGVSSSDVRIEWPTQDPVATEGLSGPTNILASPSALGAGVWSFTGGGGSIITTNSDDPLDIPPTSGTPVAEIVRFNANGKLQQSLTNLTVGQTYTLSIYVRVTGGTGTFEQFLLHFGTGVSLPIAIPDDGEFHRVSFTRTTFSTSATVGFGRTSFDAGTPDLTLASAMLNVGSVPLDFDETPSASFSPVNLYRFPMDTGNADYWTPTAPTQAPVLLASSVEALDIAVSGKADRWLIEESGSEIIQTDADGGFTLFAGNDYYASTRIRVDDNLGPVSVQLRVGSAYSSTIVVPQDGDWHEVASLVTAAATADRAGVRFVSVAGQRRISIGAMFLKLSDFPVGYDGGADNGIGELFATEPRIETGIWYGARGMDPWSAVQLLAAAGRAQTYRRGDRIGIRFDHERDGPEAMFTSANMVSGSFSRQSSAEGRVNQITAEFQSREFGFERDIVTRPLSSLLPADVTNSATLRTSSIDLRGIISKSTATRETDYRLLRDYLLDETASWASDVDGLDVSPGTLCKLAYPISAWGVGAKVYEDGTTTSVKTDMPFVVVARNLLAWARDLSASDWQRAAPSSAEEPIVTAATADEPAQFGGDRLAVAIEFPVSTNSRLEQSFPGAQGQVFSAEVYLRTDTGTAPIEVSLVNPSETIASAMPTLTTDWTRVAITGTQGAAEATNRFRIKQDPAASGIVTIYACRPRTIKGADDGLHAEGLENTGPLTQLVVGVRRAEDDVLGFAVTPVRSGAFAAGEAIPLSEALPFAPSAGDLLTIGPEQEGLFEVVGSTRDPDLGMVFQARTYDEAAFRDPDDYEDLDISVTLTNVQTVAALNQSNPSALPDAVSALGVAEAAITNEDTGRVEQALVVSWSLPSESVRRVARVEIWARDLDEGNSYEHVATVDGSRRTATIPSGLVRLIRGHTVEVAVQTVSPSGLRRSVGRSPAARQKVRAYFPLPPTPVRGVVDPAGRDAVYTLQASATLKDAALEIVRGGIFVHQQVALTPASTSYLGPTANWSILPESVDGEGNVPLLIRAVGPSGAARGTAVVVNDTSMTESMLLEQGWIFTTVAEGSIEDGPWSTDGTLDANLAEETVDSHEELHFDSSSSNLTGVWTSDPIDLGRAMLVHLSVGYTGRQVHPGSGTAPASGSVRGDRWTSEGPIDPADPEYGAAITQLEIRAITSSGDPGTGGVWTPCLPGVRFMRSFRLRLTIVRPAADFDVYVSRLAYAVRRIPRDFDGGTD